MNEFMSFDKMLTPGLIKIIFWLGLIFDAIYSVIALQNLGSFGLILVLFGAPMFALLWRVTCERIIISFKMHEELKRISGSSNFPNL